jgi:hypothetical protein
LDLLNERSCEKLIVSFGVFRLLTMVEKEHDDIYPLEKSQCESCSSYQKKHIWFLDLVIMRLYTKLMRFMNIQDKVQIGGVPFHRKSFFIALVDF